MMLNNFYIAEEAFCKAHRKVGSPEVAMGRTSGSYDGSGHLKLGTGLR